MLLNGGELDGARILSAKTVQQMTTNTLLPEMRFAGNVGQFVGPRVGTGWGLGFAVRTNPDFSLLPGAVGSFNWSGAWGTYFWIDPVEKLIGVQMIQVPPEASAPYREALRHLTYAALSVPASDGPSTPAVVSPDILKAYVGTYDFGASLSSRDKQAPIPALAFVGTGLEVAAMDDKVTVRQPIEGGPAEKAGVKAGDLVTEIDDVTTKGLNIGQVLDKLRGRAGTSVRKSRARISRAPSTSRSCANPSACPALASRCGSRTASSQWPPRDDGRSSTSRRTSRSLCKRRRTRSSASRMAIAHALHS